MHKQKAPICMLSRSKAPKHRKFRVTDIREKPVDFLWYRTDVDFSYRSNFATKVLLQKFPFLQNLQFLGVTSFQLGITVSFICSIFMLRIMCRCIYM